MIAFFDSKNIVQIMRMQRLNMRSIRTQTIFGDDELKMGMVLAQFGHKPFGSIPFTIIFARAIMLYNRFRHERNDSPLGRMDDGGAQHLVRIGDGPVAVHPVQTRGTVNRLGRKIRRAIEG